MPFAVSVTGPQLNDIVHYCFAEDTVDLLKMRIHNRKGIPVERQRLFVGDVFMLDGGDTGNNNMFCYCYRCRYL